MGPTGCLLCLTNDRTAEGSWTIRCSCCDRSVNHLRSRHRPVRRKKKASCQSKSPFHSEQEMSAAKWMATRPTPSLTWAAKLKWHGSITLLCEGVLRESCPWNTKSHEVRSRFQKKGATCCWPALLERSQPHLASLVSTSVSNCERLRSITAN